MDRGILFSAPMIRALLAGTKTQTRRVLKPESTSEHWPTEMWPSYLGGKRIGASSEDPHVGTIPAADGGLIWHGTTPYAPGDRLWVREAFAEYPVELNDDPACIWYRADGRTPPSTERCHRWRPSIHMPRWASRLTLTVTDVRVQRLNDISADDAEAEGITIGGPDVAVYRDHAATHPEAARRWDAYRIRQYRDLWNSLHGPDAWAANPWCCALTFTVGHHNIDQVPPCA